MGDGRLGQKPEDIDGAAAGSGAPAVGRARRWQLSVAGVAVAVAAGAVLVARPWAEPDRSPSAPQVNAIVDQKVATAVSALQALPPASASVFNTIRPAVVLIQAEGKAGADKSKLGSGVVVNAQGEILTSLHVVQEASAVKVTFADGTETNASVKSSDADHDIAVLTPARLPEVVVPAVLGGGVRIGDEAFAVGHPLGLVDSLSAGVISGLDREFPLTNGKTLRGMIQFDTAVNPGNSGGPLLNREGQVIGIVTGLANSAGADQFIGIGFAVSISTAGGAAGAPPR